MSDFLINGALGLTSLSCAAAAIWYRRSAELARRAGGDALRAERAANTERIHDIETRSTLERAQLEEHVDRKVASLEEELVEFRDVNVTWSEQNQQLRQLVDARAEHIARLERELATLRAERVVQTRHVVILDGMPKSGKTTFVERLVNPTATADQLRMQAATMRPYHTSPVPLGWELKNDQMVLHTLQFWDIAGENPAGLFDVLTELSRESAAPGPDEVAQVGRAVALTIWDSSATVDENLRFLSPARIHTIFGARITRKLLSSIVVFLNKADVLEQRLRDDASAALDMALEGQKRVIREGVFEKVLEMYPDLTFTNGSALTGAGVHACLGELVKGLQLGHLYGRTA